MYEVRDESNKIVAQSTSLARALSEADCMAKESASRFVVVQCKTVYVAEAAPVTELPNEPVYRQRYGKGNFIPFVGTVTARLKDWLTQDQPPEEPEEIDKLLGHTPADPQSLKHRTKP